MIENYQFNVESFCKKIYSPKDAGAFLIVRFDISTVTEVSFSKRSINRTSRKLLFKV